MLNFKEKTVNYKNQTFNMIDLMFLSNCYKVICTMEYLIETEQVKDEEEAFVVAVNVRNLMEKYGYTEQEAINEIFCSNR